MMTDELKVELKSDVNIAWQSRQGVAKLLTKATSARVPSDGNSRNRTARYPTPMMAKTGMMTLNRSSMRRGRRRDWRDLTPRSCCGQANEQRIVTTRRFHACSAVFNQNGVELPTIWLNGTISP